MFNVQTINCMQYNSEQVVTEGVIATRSNRMKFRLGGGVKCKWFIYLFIYFCPNQSAVQAAPSNVWRKKACKNNQY